MNPLPWIDPSGLEKYLDEMQRRPSLVYLAGIVLTGLSLASLPLVRVDVVVRGAGIVRPSTEKTSVTAPIGERIDRVCVQEGKKVKVGDTLLTFESAGIEAILRSLRTDLNDLEGQLADLSGAELSRPEHRWKTARWREEQALSDQQLDEARQALEQSNRMMARYTPLHEKGVVSDEEYEGYRFEQSKSLEAYQTLRQQIRASRKSRRDELVREREVCRSDIRQQERLLALHVLTAPVGGTLDEFVGWYPGAYVAQGSPIGLISPDTSLCVECRIPSSDIGFLHTGMSVRILVDAFDHNQWGSLPGSIRHISSDGLPSGEQLYYKVICRLDRQGLGRHGRLRLKKGMTVRACFNVTRRTLFQWLYEKADQWFDPNLTSSPLPS